MFNRIRRPTDVTGFIVLGCLYTILFGILGAASVDHARNGQERAGAQRLLDQTVIQRVAAI